MNYSSSLLVPMSLAAMLILATPIRYNLFANAQTSRSVASVNYTNLKVEKVVDGLVHPTAIAFIDYHRLLLLEKDKGTVRMVKDGKLP